MKEISDGHQQFKQICAKLQWRCTSARLAVFQYILENKNHPAVEIVWLHVRRTMPTISRDSVYRILNDFVSAGLLARLDQIENARYDTDLSHHGHFICRKCGEIFDFAAVIPGNSGQESIPDFGEADYVELRIIGVCKKCLQNKNSSTKNVKE